MAKMGRPPVDSQAINVRMENALIDQIDDLRRLEKDLPNRPEMIRRIVKDHIARHTSAGAAWPVTS